MPHPLLSHYLLRAHRAHRCSALYQLVVSIRLPLGGKRTILLRRKLIDIQQVDPTRLLGAIIYILKSHDIILAQIRPRLHLNEFQRNSAGVLQPVFHTERYIGRFVLGN
jgi:hypothetical protein